MGKPLTPKITVRPPHSTVGRIVLAAFRLLCDSHAMPMPEPDFREEMMTPSAMTSDSNTLEPYFFQAQTESIAGLMLIGLSGGSVARAVEPARGMQHAARGTHAEETPRNADWAAMIRVNT